MSQQQGYIDIYYSRYSHIMSYRCWMFVKQNLWKSYRLLVAQTTHLPGAPCCRDINILLLCCCFGGKQQIGDKKQNRNGSIVVWANRLLSMNSGCSYERAGGWFLCPGRLESVLSLAKRLDIDFTMKLTPTSSCCGTAFRRKKTRFAS